MITLQFSYLFYTECLNLEIDNTPAEDAKQKVDDPVPKDTQKQQDNQQPVLSPKNSDHDKLSDVVEGMFLQLLFYENLSLFTMI